MNSTLFPMGLGLGLILAVAGPGPSASAGPGSGGAASLGRAARKTPTETVGPATCVAHYRARRFRSARRCFRALLKQTGPNAQILYAIGYASYQLGEHHGALATFRRVLRLQPADGDALFMSGMALAQLRRHRQALTHFQRALKVGLNSESPTEARRYVRMLRKLLASRLRSGWLWSASLSLGYDSHPRLDGSAAAAGTSDGSGEEGSGFLSVAGGLGYRGIRVLRRRKNRVLRGALSLAYRFSQVILFSDLSRASPGPGGWRGSDVTGGLSLQTHGLGVAARLLGHRWDAGLRLGGRAELSGLRDFTPLLAGGDLAADLTVRWHQLTASHLSVGYHPQRALNDAVGYLTGHGLVTSIRQSLRLKRLRLSAGYRLGVWWLGRLITPTVDCTAGEACGLDLPYGNHAHRGRLRLGVRATRWLSVDVHVAVTHRTYWEVGEYRLAAGGLRQRQRVDLMQQYRLAARFLLVKDLHLTVAYDFTRNRSTIDLESVGIDEGYDRHRAWASLSYQRW